MKMNDKKFSSLAFLLLLVVSLQMGGCKKAAIVDRTTEDVNITGYLDEHAEFSEFRKIMQLSGTSGFLQAYGAYTLFVPTNDAISIYLKEKGVSNVQDLGTKEQLRDLVYLHVIPDSIRTTDFSDGKLRNPTMLEQYIITGASKQGESSVTTINKQANLLKGNISVGNGVIHVIDNVLKPATQTVAQAIESNPNFSIFARALKETGFYDRLNKSPRENDNFSEKYLTVFAETDAALAAATYDTYEKLRARYSTLGDPTNPKDSLYIYVAYHIATSARYYPELITTASASTFAVPTVSISSTVDDVVMLDELQIGETLEPGSPLLRSESDISASNGVVHSVTRHFTTKKRFAQPVYYDIADQPEFRRLPQWKSGTADYSPTQNPKVARILFGQDRRFMRYIGNDAGAAGRDLVMLPIGGTSRPLFWDIITPFVAKGKYRLWICFKRHTGASGFGVGAFYFNGKKLSREITFGGNASKSGYAGATEQEAEQAGWKWYVGPTSNLDSYLGRSLGIVEVLTDGPQTVRIEGIGGAFGDNQFLDMIHLIPDGMDQIWPRFDADGKKVFRPVTP